MDQRLKSLCDEVDRAGTELAIKTEGVKRRLGGHELEVSKRFLELTEPKSRPQTAETE